MRRESRQREAVLRVLTGSRAHLTADQVYDAVRKDIPNISKGTVYRNLKVLRQDGAISELNLDGALGRYEAKRETHYHFRCDRCGSIFDLDEPVDKELDERVSRKTGFTVSHHKTEFRGLCVDCQRL
jgi:Fur family peroxide stress response transcriptional regulator